MTSSMSARVAAAAAQGRPEGEGSRRILTVCLGNYCRSPLAAEVLARLAGAAVEVQSAGIRDKWAGKPAHPMMIAAAAERGFDLTDHRGQQVTPELMEWADVILAMDGSNLRALLDLADEGTAPKLALYLGDRDVPDPFGHSQDVFAACVEVIAGHAPRHLT
ncbi:low molecular weight protein-tyrosine-phosphatase [Streptomyces sp. WMMC940]|uniref:low molecular weight protein-tyrosine-phosphatase n=1 Tax=Streptomyces sp. WMMC940 TaxID=3015153 RepID=UPI0022B72294|nr:low molecular weight protein-tyrosine-phosphatase [Streptomyces sp. WMMC940]MCZ7458237.1 low molecular weight phosphotyrosine protein phosphatase [Streptomyces sp. WMMC940]